MVYITDATLTISHDHTKKTARPIARAKINFSPIEFCMMKNCQETKLYRVNCQLWGSDPWPNPDDYRYTYNQVFYLPDQSPNASESVTFDNTVGQGVLNEDWGRDEIYAKIIAYNLFTFGRSDRNTNTVKHHF